MLKTIREEVVGKVTMRLLQDEGGYVGAIVGGKPIPPVHGDDPGQVWAKLRADVGKASPHYFGYDGARARFLKLFPDGFADAGFLRDERNYKVTASEYLRTALPLEAALNATVEHCELAARTFSKTNMLSQFEQARTRDVLKGKDGVGFIRAAAALANGETAASLAEIERIFRPHGTPSWPAATYLPFLWRPDTQMFLKPEVTKDFAARIGHPFAMAYGAKLEAPIYLELLDLAGVAMAQLDDLGPRDMIDVQSFIWIVGAYPDETP